MGLKDIFKNIKEFSLNPNIPKTTMGFDKNLHNLSLKVGDYSYRNVDKDIWNNVEIGRFCSIGPDVLLGVPSHPMNWLSTHSFQYQKFFKIEGVAQAHWDYGKPTKIGNDVWIGANTTILNGVTIGDGAIIGAHTFVNKDIPPYAITVGTPCKVIKYRFDETTIERLLELKWWDLPVEKLQNLPFDDINKCLKILEQQQ